MHECHKIMSQIQTEALLKNKQGLPISHSSIGPPSTNIVPQWLMSLLYLFSSATVLCNTVIWRSDLYTEYYFEALILWFNKMYQNVLTFK